MPSHSIKAAFFAVTMLGLIPVSAMAGDQPEFSLKIENHRFVPETLTIPAGKRVLLHVTNADTTPEEFESYELDREKIIVGGSTAKIYIGPLDPGTYPFFGEFHQDTAKGRVLVK